VRSAETTADLDDWYPALIRPHRPFSFNGRLASAVPFRPNDAIKLRALEDACHDGFSLAHLMAPPRRLYRFYYPKMMQHGLAAYKRKRGAEPRLDFGEATHRVRRSPRSQAGTASLAAASSAHHSRPRRLAGEVDRRVAGPLDGAIRTAVNGDRACEMIRAVRRRALRRNVACGAHVVPGPNMVAPNRAGS
jgi:hypothetical protein